MEILSELKKLSQNTFLDNFYLCLGLIFIVFYQLIKEYLLLMKKFALWIHNKIQNKINESIEKEQNKNNVKTKEDKK